jgi:hypothetical protein
MQVGESLTGFKVSLLRFTLRALESIELPPFSGSTFRGAFGAEFRRIACLPQCNDPATCTIAGHCAYARIFEARPNKEGYTPAGEGGLPRPFVIHPPPGGGQIVKPGAPFVFHMALVGWAADYVPYFILTWRELGRIGIGRGRGEFRLESVESCASIDRVAGNDESVRLIYSLEDELVRNCLEPLTATGLMSLHPALGKAGLAANDQPSQESAESDGSSDAASIVPTSLPAAVPTRLSIELVTPLRVKSKGEFLRSELPFEVLAGALIRRLETLSFFYCGGSLELDYRGLVETARQVRTESSNLRWVEWERYSRRQDRRIPWGGIVGRVEYSGDLSRFLPFLVLGEILGVGNNCAFGLGRYEVHHSGRKKGE